ncbi:MAG: hypothetical protein JW874_05210 [Spirochaetales bacterium]|nr:hypothetical protein [Spirochaetales bacterium]
MKKCLLLFTFLIMVLIHIFPEDTLPVWLVFEKARNAYFSNDLAESFRLFRQCLDKKAVYPEADLWLGEIYEKEGEYDLAMKQYEKAAKNKKHLYVLNEYISILYHIASVYERKHLYQQYENTLLEICRMNPVFSDNKYLEYQKSIISTFENRGINNALELYRFNVASALDAHRQLGMFYYLTGRYHNSFIHLCYATISASTALIDYFHSLDPEFIYSDFSEFLRLAERYPNSIRFFEEMDLYQIYYYLAAVLFARGRTDQAKEIWWQVLKYDETGEWGIRSHLQYKEPYIEPLLNVNPPY